MSHETRYTFLVVMGTAGILAALGFSALAPGCSAQPCTQTDPTRPTPTFDCPAGQLCYLEECVPACNAGEEQAETCTVDDDCGSTRPKCVGGFCSACDSDEYCVPTLDICQVVVDFEIPEPPDRPPPGVTKPPYPSDGGWIDGGIRLTEDSGVVGPQPEVAFTHIGHVDIAQVRDFSGGQPVERTAVSMVAYRIAAPQTMVEWRPDLPLPVQATSDLEEEECTLSTLTEFSGTAAPAAVDFGDVRITDSADYPNSLLVPVVTASFEPAQSRYVLEPALPMLPVPVIRFSNLAANEPHFLVVGSPGAEVTDMRGWPNPAPRLGLHVPFELVPTGDSPAKLAAPELIANPPTASFDLSWDRIDTGQVASENVHLRILGPNVEISCQQEEGAMGQDTIRVAVSLLTRFRQLAGPGTYPLYFERASLQRLALPGAPGNVIFMTARVRHTLESRLRFE